MKLLPDSSSKLELAIDNVIAKRLRAIDFSLNSLWNPDTCPEKYLYILAWTFNVTLWDELWSERTKREVIKKWLIIRKYRGTKYALEMALEILNLKTDIREWYQYYIKRQENVIDVYIWTDENSSELLEKTKKLVIQVVDELKPVTAICNVYFGVRLSEKVRMVSTMKMTTIKRITLSTMERVN